MKTYILLPWTKSLSLAMCHVDQLLLLSQFPYRFQRMDSVPGTRARSGMEHHLIFYSHSSQWTSSDCLPHQSGHSVVQESLWNLFSHHPGTRPPWHLYLLLCPGFNVSCWKTFWNCIIFLPFLLPSSLLSL